METSKLKTSSPALMKAQLEEVLELPCRGFRERNIFKQVAEHYGVRVSYDTDGNIDAHHYPYYSNGEISGYKIRQLPKDFRSVGTMPHSLFGMNNYTGGRRLVITEGELDAMAIQSAWYKKYKAFYPVVSLRSASSVKDLIEHREWVRNFDEVILWFDNDEAGKTAVKEACRIIGFDKVKVTSSKEKDACDVWIKEPDEVLKTIWNAVDYTPAGILNKGELWNQLERYNDIESIPYPGFMEGLNEKLKGMRTGEITLWTSGTGSGKSTLLREIAFHLLETK